MVLLGAAAPRLLVTAWLLLTNLSLGLHHRHEVPVGPHHAAPQAWHYHVLLLGMEWEFLSLTSETCPFRPTDAPGQETHVLLSSLLAPGTNHDQSPAVTHQPTDLLCLPLVGPNVLVALPAPANRLGLDILASLPPPTTVLSARSGVQQI